MSNEFGDYLQITPGRTPYPDELIELPKPDRPYELYEKELIDLFYNQEDGINIHEYEGICEDDFNLIKDILKRAYYRD